MSNQDLDGKVPADGAFDAPAAPAGTPESLEQQLAKERDARVLMRDRLRHTEALAAESHALRARMAQVLERVTADRDRLRTAAANAPAAVTSGAATPPSPAAAEPQFTPRMTIPPERDWSLRPPAPPARKGPWRALAMLGGLAAGVAALAWITGSLPGESGTDVAAASAATASQRPSSPVVAATRPIPPASAVALATAAPSPAPTPASSGGAVALPPLTAEQQLAMAPTAAGPAPASASAPAAPAPATAAGISARLRTALDGEGIAAPVEVDASTGHVVVADPQADHASRDRTDLVIRAVYAGASLPEPQIEHRWLSPRRGERAVAAPVAPAPAPAVKTALTSGVSAAAAYAARHAAAERPG